MHETPTLLKETPAWRAAEQTRRWLLFGALAALLNGGLQVAGTVLELRFWNHVGLTPDVAIEFAAVLPQIVLLVSFLGLARDADSRGLWKGAAGFFMCGWLGLFLSLAMYETLPRWLAVAVSIGGGVGIVAVAIFLFGKWPRFPSVASVASEDDSTVEDVSSKASAKKSESEGPGCLGHLIFGGIVFAIRILVKKNKQWFAWLPGDAESWVFLEMLAVLLLMLVFAVWFAAAKIRLRHKLGGVSAVVGCAEFLIAVLHVAMIAIGMAMLITVVVENPNIGDDEIGERFDGWAQAAVVGAGALYCAWSLLVAWLFAAVRKLSEPDWRTTYAES